MFGRARLFTRHVPRLWPASVRSRHAPATQTTTAHSPPPTQTTTRFVLTRVPRIISPGRPLTGTQTSSAVRYIYIVGYSHSAPNSDQSILCDRRTCASSGGARRGLAACKARRNMATARLDRRQSGRPPGGARSIGNAGAYTGATVGAQAERSPPSPRPEFSRPHIRPFPRSLATTYFLPTYISTRPLRGTRARAPHFFLRRASPSDTHLKLRDTHKHHVRSPSYPWARFRVFDPPMRFGARHVVFDGTSSA